MASQLIQPFCTGSPVSPTHRQTHKTYYAKTRTNSTYLQLAELAMWAKM